MTAERRDATTPEALYELMARYLRECGWTREEEGSGWWWAEHATSDLTIGEAVEEQLCKDGIDTRTLVAGEAKVFYGTP